MPILAMTQGVEKSKNERPDVSSTEDGVLLRNSCLDDEAMSPDDGSSCDRALVNSPTSESFETKQQNNKLDRDSLLSGVESRNNKRRLMTTSVDGGEEVREFEEEDGKDLRPAKVSRGEENSKNKTSFSILDILDPHKFTRPAHMAAFFGMARHQPGMMVTAALGASIGQQQAPPPGGFFKNHHHHQFPPPPPPSSFLIADYAAAVHQAAMSGKFHHQQVGLLHGGAERGGIIADRSSSGFVVHDGESSDDAMQLGVDDDFSGELVSDRSLPPQEFFFATDYF